MMRNSLRKSPIYPVPNEKGIALAVVIGIMSVLLLLGGTTLQMASTEIQISGNYQSAVQALHAAESGVETVYHAFEQGDTNGDGIVNGLDLPNAINDLDSNGKIDFVQAFIDKTDVGSAGNRLEVNSGNTRALIWVDASKAPTRVFIHSRGNPAGTITQKEVTLIITTSGKNISHGALNNAT